MKQMEIPGPETKEKPFYIMKLFVIAGEPNSQLARDNLKRICDEYLSDHCRVEEVDVLVDFASALNAKVFVTPTLVLIEPGPRATIIGNLNNKERVIAALRLRV